MATLQIEWPQGTLQPVVFQTLALQPQYGLVMSKRTSVGRQINKEKSALAKVTAAVTQVLQTC